MPILLVLLVLIFGSFAAASLPLAIGVTAILGAFTALRAFALFTDVSIFAVNIVTITRPGPGDRLRAVRGQPVPRGDRAGSRDGRDARWPARWPRPAARSRSPASRWRSRWPGC